MKNENRLDSKPHRHVGLFILLICIILFVGITVGLLVVVFAVESAWFSDSFNVTTSVSNQNNYGLWRLCISQNQTCLSWFTSDGQYASWIDQRLNQSRAAINAWQALQIVFLFLISSTSFILIFAFIFSFKWTLLQYYLTVLAAFTSWPAVAAGITALFVFGFSVYIPSTTPRSLQWCFYVDIAAVALGLLSSMLLTVYTILLGIPKKKTENRPRISQTIPDFYSPSISMSQSETVRGRSNEIQRAPERTNFDNEFNRNPINQYPPSNIERSASRPDTSRSMFDEPFSTLTRQEPNFEATNTIAQRFDRRNVYLPSDYVTGQTPMFHYQPSSEGFDASYDSYYTSRTPMGFRNEFYRA